MTRYLSLLLATLALLAGCHPSPASEPQHRYGASSGQTPSQRAAIATPTWYVGCASCGGTASDSNNCTSATTPCATFGELSRRYGPGTVLQPASVITLHVQGNVADGPSFDLESPIGGQFRIIADSAASSLVTGTLTGVTAINAATNTPQDVTAGAIGDWSTACPGGTSCVNKRLCETSGNLDCAWIAKRTAATVARTSPFGKITSTVTGALTNTTPAGNETFAVQSLYTIGSPNIRIRTLGANTSVDTMKLQIDGLSIQDTANLPALNIDCGPTSLGSTPKCLVSNSHIGARLIYARGATFSNCLLYNTAAAAIPILGNSVGSDLTVNGGLGVAPSSIGISHSNVIFQQDFLLQGGSGSGFVDSSAEFGSVGIFDSSGAGLTLRNTRVYGFGTIYGSGNATFGWTLNQGAHVTWASGKQPTLTGTTNDVNVGGVYQRVYSSAASIPFVDPGADIVFTSVPALTSLSNVQCDTSTFVNGTKTISTGITVTASSRVVANMKTLSGETTCVRIDVPSASRTVGAPGTGALIFNCVTAAGVVDAGGGGTFDYCIFD